MIFGIIYKITNKINGVSYVGQTTKTISQRWTCHKNKNSSCRFLKYAISKYGAENFEIKEVAKCNSIDEMNHRESYYIRLFKSLAPNGYNLTTGGKNKLASEETKQKMRESQIGKKMSPVSNETKLKISKTLTGRKVPKWIIDGMSKKNSKKILIKPLNIVFNSLKEVEEIVGISTTAIRQSRSGIKNRNGYTITYCEKGKDYTQFLHYNMDTKDSIEKQIVEYRINKQIKKIENLHLIALKYVNITDFCTFNKKEYQMAWEIGVLNQICTHMSRRESEKTEAIKHKIQCTESGEIYKSLTDAAKSIKCSIALLSLHLNGKTKTAKGYTFKRII